MNLESHSMSPNSARASARTLYVEHAPFVRQVLRSHGVATASLDDAVQDVFLVTFRRLRDFVPRASHRSWLYGIATRIAKDHRRRARRKQALLGLDTETVACPASDPCARVMAVRAYRRFCDTLGAMDEARRRVFILAEVEEMTAPEIADRLSVKLNTVYSRLRAARREFRVVQPNRAARSRPPSRLGTSGES